VDPWATSIPFTEVSRANAEVLRFVPAFAVTVPLITQGDVLWVTASVPETGCVTALPSTLIAFAPVTEAELPPWLIVISQGVVLAVLPGWTVPEITQGLVPWFAVIVPETGCVVAELSVFRAPAPVMLRGWRLVPSLAPIRVESLGIGEPLTPTEGFVAVMDPEMGIGDWFEAMATDTDAAMVVCPIGLVIETLDPGPLPEVIMLPDESTLIGRSVVPLYTPTTGLANMFTGATLPIVVRPCPVVMIGALAANEVEHKKAIRNIFFISNLPRCKKHRRCFRREQSNSSDKHHLDYSSRQGLEIRCT
jgi:hypothetical protein